MYRYYFAIMKRTPVIADKRLMTDNTADIDTADIPNRTSGIVLDYGLSFRL